MTVCRLSLLASGATTIALLSATPATAQAVDVGAPPPADQAKQAQKEQAAGDDSPTITMPVTTAAPNTDTRSPPTDAAAAPDVADTRHRPSDLSPSAVTADTRAAPPPGLIGDWRKVRTYLNERGVTVTARYASESGYNFSGGDRKLFRETGQFDVGALFDLERVVGLEGGAIQATVTWRRGEDLTTDAGLGVLQQVQEVYGRGQTVRMTQLWYEQRIGEAVEVKLGRTNPGEDFAVFSCHFMNLSFCGAQPGNLVGDYWYNWPVSQWGARLNVALDKAHYVRAAVYEENPRNLDTNFFIGHFHGATGVLVPVEAGWSHGVNDGRVGSIEVGGWISTARRDDVFFDVTRRPIAVTGLAPLRRNGAYGVYASLQQQLTGKSKGGKALSGLSMFANVTQTDRKTSVTDNQIALGIFYKGLIPARPGDVVGFALARTNVNGRAAAADLLTPDTPHRDAEYASELYYSISPFSWMELLPNVQLIHHPGGIRNATDVGVIGLKAAITL